MIYLDYEEAICNIENKDCVDENYSNDNRDSS